MATQTISLAQADEGRVRWELDYDDATLFATAIRITNDSHLGPNPGTAGSQLWLVNDPSRKFPPTPRLTAAGVTEERPIPSNAANRLQLTVSDHRGQMRVDNLDGQFDFPV